MAASTSLVWEGFGNFLEVGKGFSLLFPGIHPHTGTEEERKIIRSSWDDVVEISPAWTRGLDYMWPPEVPSRSHIL